MQYIDYEKQSRFLSGVAVLYREIFQEDFFTDNGEHIYNKDLDDEQTGFNVPNIVITLPVINRFGGRIIVTNIMQQGLFTTIKRRIIKSGD